MSPRELTCDVLVVGGDCGGVAAALAATALGRTVVLTEAGDRWAVS
jgi:glycerol-3-phosphate dehydrogenase